MSKKGRQNSTLTIQQRNNAIRKWLLEHQPLGVGTDFYLAKKFKTSPDTIEHLRRRLGLKIEQIAKEVDEMAQNRFTVSDFAEEVIRKIKEIPIEALPEIPLYRITRGDGDEEEVVLMLSDWQLGHKTRSFNSHVAQERVVKLVKALCKIVALHRKAYPIRKLNLFLLGDFIQSEKVGYLVDLAELEDILLNQIFQMAVPLLKWLIVQCLHHFSEVHVYAVRGNHGRGERGSSEKTNWDDVIYRCLEQIFADNKRVVFHLTSDFYQIATIQGKRFLLAHGDQVRSGSYNIPLYALLQRMLRWGSSIPGWDVLCVGHWHCYGHLDQNDKQLIVNGTLVSDDDYVLKAYGWTSSTLQVMFGVHPRKGVTFQYRLKLNGGD